MELIAIDIMVKFKLEGHDRGVNWAIFHPTLQLIASASDDRNIKIWKFHDNRWSEADTLRGHANNVSSVAFHPQLDYLISNSEDKSIRIWDLSKKVSVEIINKGNDRLWVLGVHPNLNIFASGSDSGLTVFKLESFRIPSACFNNQVIYYQNKAVRQMKFGETSKNQIGDVKAISKGLRHGVVSIVINPFINPQQILNYALLVSDGVNKRVLYYYMKFEQNKFVGSEQVFESTIAVCFISNNRVLTLTSNGNLVGFDTSNISNKFIVELPNLSKDRLESIYQAPVGKVLIKFKNGIVGLLDVNTKKIVAESNEMTDLKYVTWNTQLSVGALVGTNSIFLINRNLDLLSKVKENSSINSVTFDENNVLFYSTHFHLKYALQDGLSGILKSTEVPYYIMMVNNGTFYMSDAQQNIKTENLNYTQIRFKLSLFNKNYDDIVQILRSGAIQGIKAIEDIKNAGFPDLSLKFVNDPKQKFNLAIQSGKLEVD